jgi:hypothetical protein
MIYRAEYTSHHKRANSPDDLFQDFPLESRTLKSVSDSHSTDVLARDRTVILILPSTEEHVASVNSYSSKPSDFLRSSFQKTFECVEGKVPSLTIEILENKSVEFIVMVDEVFEMNPNLLRRFLVQAMDLSIGEALFVKSGTEPDFFKSPIESFLSFQKSASRAAALEDGVKLVIGRLAP